MGKSDWVELSNVEIYQHCLLNKITGEKKYHKKKRIHFFTGLYFEDDNVFFAIYPTPNGPTMYYEKKEYLLYKELHIALKKEGKIRIFSIEEYDIHIEYLASPYIGFDVWSEEEDVDLLYQIAKYYKDDKYYEKFTKKSDCLYRGELF
jgi:hypothetical protein